MQRNTAIENEIRNALLNLVEKKPFYRIKVVDIIKECDIGRTTFYDHFDSVFDVMQSIEDEYFEKFLEKRQELKVREFSDLYTMVNFSSEYLVRLFRILVGPNGDPAFEMRFKNHNKRIIKEMVVEVDDPDEQKMLAEFCAGGIWELLRFWAFNSDDLSRSKVLKFHRKLKESIKSFDK